MDNAYFSQLLGMAAEKQKDKQQNSSSSKYISTKIAAPSKRPPKPTKQSSRLENNVKAFMERQEAEKKAKEREQKAKTKKLLELRQGSKEGRRAQNRMLKMTKSANKSVLEDATSTTDTADTLAGRNQCDEDDYGYESNAARGFYEKLMSKYEANPDDPMAKFSKSVKPKKAADLGSTISRVKESLARGASPPPRMADKSRKGSSKQSGGSNDPDEEGISWKTSERVSHVSSTSGESVRRKEKSSYKSSGPPKPKVSFSELMRKAKENAKNPKPIDDLFKSAKKTEVKECEFDRPMTEKEKAEYRREKMSQARREGKGPSPEDKAASAAAPAKPTKSKPMPASKKAEAAAAAAAAAADSKQKQSKPSSRVEPARKQPAAAEPSPALPPGREAGKLSQAQIDKLKARGSLGSSSSQRPPSSHSKAAAAASSRPRQPPADVEPRPFPGERGYREGAGSSAGPSSQREPPSRPQQQAKKQPPPVESRAFPGERGYREPGAPTSSSSRRNRDRSASPDEDIGGGSRRKFNPDKMSNKRGRHRIESDSEEEVDSEMDDFIDDSEAKFDISAEIRGIFGYDRRRFRDEDDFDDRAMENNSFASHMREEAVSARIGRQEDLEDMRREEEELKRKMARKKMRR